MGARDRIDTLRERYESFAEALDALYLDYPEIDERTRWGLVAALEQGFSEGVRRIHEETAAEEARDPSTVYALGRFKHLADKAEERREAVTRG